MSSIRSTTLPLIALVFSLPMAACQAETDDADDAAMDDAAMADGMTDGMADRMDQAPPDTTDAAVWAHLQEADYRANWDLWPGTAELYAGTEPHGMLLTTYANATAAAALDGGMVDDLPEGSIIVKENYMPDSTFAAATVMMKVEGYNPDHADWLFAKYQPDGTVDAFGRAQGCQSCHQQADGGNYIYTAVGQ